MKNYANFLKAVCFLFLAAAIVFIGSCKKSSTVPPANATAVTTANMSAVTSSTATGGGTINDISADFIACGICWDTKPDPTIALTSKVVSFNKTLSFSGTLTGLSGGITYYVRAFETTTAGVTYGNQVSFTSTPATIAIGNSYAGGLIFYSDSTKMHGLVAAPYDQASSVVWDNGNFQAFNALFTTSTAIGYGKMNTDSILNVLGTSPNYAALTCTGIVINGFSDWFLPSRDELYLVKTKLYDAKLGNFTGQVYWSSSTDVVTSFYAWEQNMVDGSFKLILTSNPESVRAVRAF